MILIRNNKKSQMEAKEMAILIIAIVVLIIAFFAISGGADRILSWARGLPSFEPANDSIRNLSVDTARLLDYEPIGFVTKITKEIPKINWVKVGQWNIILLDKTMLSQSDCDKYKYNWKKNVCYDYFTFISDKLDDAGCQQYGTYRGKDGCFDNEGKTMWNKKYVQTGIYVNWKSGEGAVNGDLVMYRPGLHFNQAIGKIENDFFKVDLAAYQKYKSELLARGVLSTMMDDLNSAKYVNGGIYKYKTAGK